MEITSFTYKINSFYNNILLKLNHTDIFNIAYIIQELISISWKNYVLLINYVYYALMIYAINEIFGKNKMLWFVEN